MRIECISEYEKIKKNPEIKERLRRFVFLDSDDKFKITRHRDGKYPAIITISGFLTENLDNRLNWEKSVLSAFPDREWFHLEWNPQKNPFKKVRTNKPVPYKAKPENPGKLLKLIGTSSLLYYKVYSSLPFFLINNWWHLAVRNSYHTGKLLAETLIACGHKEFILVGHSLGARVIFNCLAQIGASNVESNIQEVYLLGGAVNSRVPKWNKIIGTVKDKVYNYYSKNDDVLKTAYSPIMIDRFPIGLNKIDLPYVENIDSTEDIFGHSEYIPKFHDLKHKTDCQITTSDNHSLVPKSSSGV